MSERPVSCKMAVIVASVFAVPVFTVPAYAYIDPGTASIVLQSIIGGIAAAGLFFRSHIMGFYYKIFPGRAKPAPGNSAGDQTNDAG